MCLDRLPVLCSWHGGHGNYQGLPCMDILRYFDKFLQQNINAIADASDIGVVEEGYLPTEVVD
eukprot:1954273-Amphidinium_carterae.1